MQVLRVLGVHQPRLLTNNPLKVLALQSAGWTVERVPSVQPAGAHCQRYLAAKRDRMDHVLPADLSILGNLPRPGRIDGPLRELP